MAQALSRPRFRTDLVAEPIDDDGERYIDVTDPDSGATFRFFEVEYAIACAMDGTRDLPQLVDWANEELGLRPPAGELEVVIGTLRDLGYLEAASNGISTAPRSAAATAPAATTTTARSRDDVELGHAGRAAPAAAAGRATGKTAGNDDLELGAPGASAVPAAATPASPFEDFALAPPSAQARAAATARSVIDSDDDPMLGPPGASVNASGGRSIEFEALTPPEAQAAMAPQATLRPTTRPDADDDGPTNLPAAVADFDDDDVSVDLSEHLGTIRAEDVKEAVRASKVMQAVTVPPALLAQLEAAEGKAPAVGASASNPVVAASKPITTESKPVVTERKPAPIPVATPAAEPSRPIELPNKPVSRKTIPTRPPAGQEARAVAQEPAKAPAQAKRGVSAILVVLLVVALLGGAAAFYYFNYMQDDGPPPVKPPPARIDGKVGGAATTPPPPPPGPVTATLAARPAESAQIKARNTLKVAEIAKDGSEVAQDTVIVTFGNYKKLVKELEDNLNDQRRYKDEIERKVNVAKRTKDLAGKQQREAELVTELDGLVLKAPLAGTVRSPVKLNTTVKPDDIVALIEGKQMVGATFSVPPGKTYAVDQNVELKAQSADDVRASCRVAAVEGDKITVACPADKGLTAETIVILP